MWEKAKCASSLKNLKFIIPRGIQGSSKKEKIHQAQKGASALRQERSLENASKGPKSIKLRKKGGKNVPKSSFNQEKKEKKPARLKTQKGSLGKS